MIKLKVILIILVCLSGISTSWAQVSLAKIGNGANEFELVKSGKSAELYYDVRDFEVVKKVANLFGDDIRLVTGREIAVSEVGENMSSNCIIVGTLGYNEMIDKLILKKKLDVSALKNKWESFHVEVICNPFPGVKKALVIVGSDRRGTAYGLFSISEAIGISPWYWWADAPVDKRKELCLKVQKITSKEPTVKYRGIFINDEDWGLLRWAKTNFEEERGNIGPKTYAKVCELLLRLKANYLCPAMHEASTAFNKIPENKLVADSFAIVMGSVHCEPLLFNNASEWDKRTMGEWDYVNNKETLNRVLKQRVLDNSPYENVYTLALRGLHDKAMGGSGNMKERVKLLSDALNAQRQILIDVIKKPANEIPQAFTPYKEVLDVYNAGLELPDDVTIIWPDDNYGYMKRLSSPREQKRSGRAGVYYHVSYLGKPHDYLWMSTVSPALMYEELRKAYDTTADRVWLANCGDLKGAETQISLFLDMAYDIDSFNADNVATYPARWLAKMFGEEYYDTLEDITCSHINLAFSRKPEYMGWGYWNNYWGGGEKRTDTEFSFANYNEAERRLTEYSRIGKKTEDLLASLDEKSKPAFYQLLYYPVKGAELMNHMTIKGQFYRQYVRQQRAAANRLKAQVKCYHDSLEIITDGYNSLLDGKWKHMMSLKQNYDGTSSYFMIPLMEEEYTPVGFPKLGLQAESENLDKGGMSFHTLPAYSTYSRKSHWIDIYNQGTGELSWSITPSEDWILISQKSGKTSAENRIHISVDWDKVPVGEKVKGQIDVTSGSQKESVLVSVFNPESPARTEVQGLYVEENGYISIPAADFHRKFESNDIRMSILPGLCFEGRSLQLGNPTAPLQMYRAGDVPRVEYDFYTFNAGIYDVYTYVLPTFPLHAERDYKLPEHTNSDTKYSVRIDDGSISTPSTSAIEYSQIWYDSVLKNCRVNKSTLYVKKPGKHTLQIRCGDPGIVIQKIVIDLGGMKRSYLGPQSTICN